MSYDKVKRSIHLTALSRSLCAELSSKDKVRWSKAVNTLSSRYDFLVSTLMPALSENEWRILFNTYQNREISDDIRDESGLIEWILRRELKLNYSAEHAKDLKPLIDKVAGWSTAQSVAALHKIGAQGTDYDMVDK